MTTEGNWKTVDEGFLAPGIVCMSHTQDRSVSDESLFESVLFGEMYLDWVVKEHFSSIKAFVVGNETAVRYSDIEGICSENGASAAYLLTKEKNMEVSLEFVNL